MVARGMRIGTLTSIHRYAVKSMQGETLDRTSVDASGIPGDRRHALIDVETGSVASAKDPRRWAQLLEFRAGYAGAPERDSLVITLPDGTPVRPGMAGGDAALSAACGRDVRVSSEPGGTYDYVWEGENIAPAEVISSTQTGTTDDGRPISAMPLGMMAPGTFQDVAPITLMTTSALRAMAALHPDGDWSPDRFRSNLLLDTDAEGILENSWEGARLRIGEVELEVTGSAPRCVMTTLPQLGLPRDRAVLRTIAQHNRRPFGSFGVWACLGAYATVPTPGELMVGAPVYLEPAPATS